MNTDELNRFTGRLADEVKADEATESVPLTRRQMVRLLRPVAKRLMTLNERLVVLEEMHPKSHGITKKKRSWFRFRLGGKD